MKYTVAQAWADAIDALMAGHKVAIIDSFERTGFEPGTMIVTLRGAHAFNYPYAPGDGNFHIASSYGIHDALEEIRIEPDKRQIVMHSKTAAGGLSMWRVVIDLDTDGRSSASTTSWERWDAAADEIRKMKGGIHHGTERQD